MTADHNGRNGHDPTANVIALVEANEKHSEALRAAHEVLDRERNDHVKEVADLRAEFGKVLGEKETDRLNAIRQVDVATSDSKASGVALAVSALSAATNTDKENIRKQLEATVGQINERLLALDRKQSEGAGTKGGIRDMGGWIFGAIMALLALGGVLVALLKP